MKLSVFKNILAGLDSITFSLEDGSNVPPHFHLTEIGRIEKSFIDCGGTMRSESRVGFQLWVANDEAHRLTPSKLSGIIRLAEEKLGIADDEIEVEYQGQTIQKFGLEYDGSTLVLTNTATACLAEDACGIPSKQKVNLSEITTNAKAAACTPGGGCC